jgi:hypothetical protein
MLFYVPGTKWHWASLRAVGVRLHAQLWCRRSCRCAWAFKNTALSPNQNTSGLRENIAVQVCSQWPVGLAHDCFLANAGTVVPHSSAILFFVLGYSNWQRPKLIRLEPARQSGVVLWSSNSLWPKLSLSSDDMPIIVNSNGNGTI